ncbi:MAG: hypothetical protein AVDCRST_MAG05-3162 [uncultured Rubrobacteraceae bacterium]|uniref:Uncharacterized protein n=1 Tax=uncultured Rubrobacteraceae bacterium TaxID=349277 RepID=A0A6J4T4Q4_9ACTN|nr:MAG: hypothetical protein AVDCRST_MAG05-3162 [uncultured Rubrobacteraceae bacterium]
MDHPHSPHTSPTGLPRGASVVVGDSRASRRRMLPRTPQSANRGARSLMEAAWVATSVLPGPR